MYKQGVNVMSTIGKSVSQCKSGVPSTLLINPTSQISWNSFQVTSALKNRLPIMDTYVTFELFL